MAFVKTYFSHDINTLADPKIAIMINIHGIISYAWWWILLEKLAEANDNKLPCNKVTFLGLSIVMEINPETAKFSTCLANVASASNAKLLEIFIKSLVEDCNLLETDGEYFWSPGMLKRVNLMEAKNCELREKRRQAGRLGGLAKSKNAKQNVASAKHLLAGAKQNLASLANNIKENNIKDIREREGTRETNIENPLSMFENEKQNNKAVYELYMKSIGDISPVIKERLDDLVETYGSERVIVAVNTTAENGGNSIKYVETVAAGNLKKEVNQANGTNKRGGGTRKTQTKTDGTEVDWSKETGEWI